MGNQGSGEQGRADGRGLDGPTRGRGRRAVRSAGTVGDVDESLLRSSFPASAPTAPTAAAGGRPADGPVTPATGPEDGRSDVQGAGDESAAGTDRPRARTTRRRAPDDEDVGWGARIDDSNDDRLTRERPPHW